MLRDLCPSGKATTWPWCHGLGGSDTSKPPFSSPAPHCLPSSLAHEISICGLGRHHPGTCSHANASHKPVLFSPPPPSSCARAAGAMG